MSVDMKHAVEDLIRMILGDREAAQGYVDDPEGTLAEAGITGADLTADDLRAAVEEACSDLDMSPTVQQTINNYTSGSSATGGPSYSSGATGSAATGGSAAPTGPAAGGAPGAPTPPPVTPPPAQPPIEMVQQHINYVTYATYEGDEHITQEIINNEITNDITNIDQSTDVNVDVGDKNDGDITIDVGNIAADDGAIAGENVTNAQTGDGVFVNGENSGAINTAEGGVANTGSIDGGVATGDNAVASGSDSNTLVGDDNTSLQADGSIEGNTLVEGDVGGDATSLSDVDNSALSFGDGDSPNTVISGNSGTVENNQQFGDGVQQNDTVDSAAAQGGGDAFGDIDDAVVVNGDTSGSGDLSNVSDLEGGSAAVVGDGTATGSDIDGSFNDNTASQFEQGPGDQTLEDVNTLDFASPEIDVTLVDEAAGARLADMDGMEGA